MSKFKFERLKDILIGGLGLIGIGYGIAMHTKLVKISDRLDKSIDDLANNMDIDISEDLVDKAVEKAVAAEAQRAVQKATNDALVELKKQIKVSVNTAVDREYENISQTVLKQITESAAKIDVPKVRKDIEQAAKDIALKKFDDNLDEILDIYRGNLNSVSKIHDSIAEAFMPKTFTPRTTDQEVVLRLR